MPKSRHRKKHKEKAQARKNRKDNQLAYVKNLTKQLNNAMQQVKKEPNVQLVSNSRLELPGQNNEQTYENV